MNRKIVFVGLITLIFYFFKMDAALAYDGNIIMTFGDSITVGYPYLPGHGWAANGCHCGPTQKKLEALLAESGRDSLVLNWGKGGESTDLGVDRIKSDIKDAISTWGKLDFVLIMEGTNDYSYGISSSTTAFNIGVMIDKARQYHAVPLVGTITPDTENSGKDVPNYNRAIANVVDDKGVLLVDHYSSIEDQWDDLNYDGLHPNLDGYEFIADDWFPYLASLIKKDQLNLFPQILMLLLNDE
jgi:lysophospholipase L1-like esterase